MKTIVIYRSKTGFTKRYAQWIGNELSCEAVDVKDSDKISFKNGDMIIYGAYIHAGMINGIKKIKKLAEEKKCRLVVFATGATPAGAKDEIKKIWQRNGIDDKIPHFYMQSGLCYEKMDLPSKLLMKIFSTIMKNKKDKSKSDADMTDAIQKSYDASSRQYIRPLIEYVIKNS